MPCNRRQSYAAARSQARVAADSAPRGVPQGAHALSQSAVGVRTKSTCRRPHRRPEDRRHGLHSISGAGRVWHVAREFPPPILLSDKASRRATGEQQRVKTGAGSGAEHSAVATALGL